MMYWILAVSMLLLNSIKAQDLSTIYPRCESRTDVNLSLKDLVHFSDVVMSGVTIWGSAHRGDFDTYKATVSFYLAYKTDKLLKQRILGRVQVENFPFLPNDNSRFLFFLVRESSFKLALYCMVSLTDLSPGIRRSWLNRVREVAQGDVDKAKTYVPPYPYPCDSNSTNHCSPVGAQCAVQNKPTNALIRCTCNIGYQGNGITCTARTEEAKRANCRECSFGARCIQRNLRGPNSVTKRFVNECNCDHFDECRGVTESAVCGTNGVTYRSVCKMKLEACRNQTEIHKLHDGRCDLSAIQPCLGIGEPLSSSVGLVKCDAKYECPAQYFCHPTKLYKVCCPVFIDGTQSPLATTEPSPTPPATIPAKPIDEFSGDDIPGSNGDEEVKGSAMGSGQFSDDEDV